MGRRKKPGFSNMKMFCSRIEYEDFYKFARLLQMRDRKNLQEILNMFVVAYISGNIIYKDGQLTAKEA